MGNRCEIKAQYSSDAQIDCSLIRKLGQLIENEELGRQRGVLFV